MFSDLFQEPFQEMLVFRQTVVAKLPRCQSLVANIFILIRMSNLSLLFCNLTTKLTQLFVIRKEIGSKNKELWMKK